ncbi:hypothetical protein CNR22_22360 [Sphingobacteriaceae bacterium]|nr:hypothetical protein CNR22_22360 [Sphingobacteriaceae bacterium]
MNTLLHFLIGTWFINYTNFPMWTKGDKLNPTFTYTLIKKKEGSELLFDEVKYKKKTKIRTIKGFDHPDKQDSSAFVWKGKGILSLLKSKWKVALKDEGGEWAVIYFSKTAFTPKGVDVISRHCSLSETQLEKIKSMMLQDNLLKEYVSTLQLLNHKQE